MKHACTEQEAAAGRAILDVILWPAPPTPDLRQRQARDAKTVLR
jgi:hypothetical protein